MKKHKQLQNNHFNSTMYLSIKNIYGVPFSKATKDGIYYIYEKTWDTLFNILYKTLKNPLTEAVEKEFRDEET